MPPNSVPHVADLNRSPKRRRLWPWLVAFLFAGAMLLLVLLFLWVRVAQTAVEKELARIRGANEPTTYEELAAAYHIPPEEVDSTADWQAVVTYFGNEEFQSSAKGMPLFDYQAEKIPAFGQPWTDQQLVSEFLSEHREASALIEAASAKQGLTSFPIRFEEGTRAELPHAQYLHAAGKFQELRFQVALRNGDHTEMEQVISQIFSMVRILEREPHLVGQMVRRSLLNTQTHLIPLFLESADASQELLTSWRRELRRFDGVKALSDALLAERVIGIQSFKDPNTYPDSEHPSSTYGSAWPRHPIQLLCYLHTCRRAQTFIDQGFPKMLAQVPYIDDWKMDSDVSSYEYFKRGYARRALISIGGSSIEVASSTTKAHACDALMAAALYHRQHHKWPESLDQLVPEYLTEVPHDAFTGERLTYYRGTDFLLIYGFGYNRKDEMGLDPNRDDAAILRNLK